MEHISVSATIDADPQVLYDFVKNMHLFPRIMKNIKSIKILERKGKSIITQWVVKIDKALIEWEEKDVFDDEKKEIHFNLLKGAFRKYQGKWSVLSGSEKKTVISLVADVDYGIMTLKEILIPVLIRKTRLTWKSMLLSIRKEFSERKTLIG